MIDRLIGGLKPHLDLKDKTLEEITEERKRTFFHVQNSRILFIGLPGWGSSFSFGRSGLKRFTEKKKISLLLYKFPMEILTSNSELTRNCFSRISEIVRADIDNLKQKYGFTRCAVLAYSLGAVMASMVYKNNPAVSDVILICPGNNLAEDMWDGCHTQFLRKEYEKNKVSLSFLKTIWKNLAPENNMPAVGTRVSLYYAKNDEIIRYREGKKLMGALARHGFKVSRKDFSMGHYFTCAYFLLFPGRFIHL